jgi:hypothetical protein
VPFERRTRFSPDNRDHFPVPANLWKDVNRGLQPAPGSFISTCLLTSISHLSDEAGTDFLKALQASGLWIPCNELPWHAGCF